ncbi:DciA family protein [Kitasatospora sp. NPDC058162]|uniref:DciA family protein n=1 Tax=Kitasatospora sp. NPDC058162 TaxID=3346362 RepID=UPI0036D8FA24
MAASSTSGSRSPPSSSAKWFRCTSTCAPGRLDLQPTSPAYATQLRLLGRQLVARINGKVGRTVVRDLRVLAPRAIAATGPDQRTEHHQAVHQPETPVRTRDDASAGYHRALAEIRRTTTAVDPAIAAATSSQVLAECRIRTDTELRASAVPLRQACPPMPLSGAA